jgi:hypothetical protein
MNIQPKKVCLKRFGLLYQEKDDLHEGFEMIILDRRLTNDVVNTIYKMIQENKTYPQMKKEFKWFTRDNLETIKKLIAIYTDPEVNYWRTQLTEARKKEFMEKKCSEWMREWKPIKWED